MPLTAALPLAMAVTPTLAIALSLTVSVRVLMFFFVRFFAFLCGVLEYKFSRLKVKGKSIQKAPTLDDHTHTKKNQVF